VMTKKKKFDEIEQSISTCYVQPMTGFFWKCKLLSCWVITNAYNNVLCSQQLLYRRYITCRPYYHIKPHNILHKPFKKPITNTSQFCPPIYLPFPFHIPALK
jgi:hypothetical protein